MWWLFVYLAGKERESVCVCVCVCVGVNLCISFSFYFDALVCSLNVYITFHFFLYFLLRFPWFSNFHLLYFFLSLSFSLVLSLLFLFTALHSTTTTSFLLHFLHHHHHHHHLFTTLPRLRVNWVKSTRFQIVFTTPLCPPTSPLTCLFPLSLPFLPSSSFLTSIPLNQEDFKTNNLP